MSPAITSGINPTDHFDADGRFQAYSFAEALLDAYTDRTDQPAFATATETDTLYFHDGHVWNDNGEQVLRKACRDILTNAASRERVNEVYRNVKSLTYQDRADIFDLPPEKLVVSNGLLDLATGDFTPWPRLKYRPGTMTRLDVEYDADARPERFLSFLQDVLDHRDVPVMLEVIGYCLFRSYPFQKAVMLLGDGANGKSTLLGGLRDFLGRENVAAVELQDLADNRFAAAELEGKLANVAPDLSDEGLESTGTFKALTGGDLVEAERKYQAPFAFENYATLLFSANQKPAAEDDTHAYKRRWVHFRFPHRFDGAECPACGQEDGTGTRCHVPASQDDLLNAFREEHAGILNVAAEAFRRLKDRGGFESTTYDAEHGEAADDLAARPILRFVKRELAEAPGEYIRVKDAYQAYTAWAKEHGHTPQGRTSHFEPAVVAEYAPEGGNDPANQNYSIWHDLRLADGPDPTGEHLTDYE